MQKYLNHTIYTLMLSILFLLFSLLIAYLTIFLLYEIQLFEHSAHAEQIKEFFARFFLLWLILAIYGSAFLSRGVRRRFTRERWAWVVIILFALGALFAMGDPLHQIRNEGNWIRYWTAGILGAAGTISAASSLNVKYPLLERLIGGFFGLLFLAAAGDELFQFHEQLGHKIDGLLSLELQTSGSDMVTLGVAAVGAVAVMTAALAWRFTPRVKTLFVEEKYRRSFAFMALAALSFLTAMMLDSFDWYLEHLADQLRATIMGHLGSNETPRWLGIDYIGQAANSLEELLEYLAALFFLMMIGTLFSIKAIGCDLPSNMNGVKAQ
jgi:hypothetical protein